MFLEELSLPIHVTAIEDRVAVDLLILESGSLLRLQVGVSLTPQAVLMRFQIFLLRLLLLVELILMLVISFVEGVLQFAETVREVAEDVGAADLHKRFIPRLQENHEFLVKVPEHMVAKYQIHTLPVA
jgi:hypothetical protein